MIQTQVATTRSTPALRRPSRVVPVLIQVPKLGPSGAPHRRGRRRLRREVRVAGCLMLALLPITIALTCLGGGRLSPLAASSLSLAPEPEAASPLGAPVVSLSLEPISSASRDFECPVFLPGTLLPADPTEEAGDGGH